MFDEATRTRERLAKWLFLDANPNDEYASRHWDAGPGHVDRGPWLKKADRVLQVIAEES